MKLFELLLLASAILAAPPKRVCVKMDNVNDKISSLLTDHSMTPASQRWQLSNKDGTITSYSVAAPTPKIAYITQAPLKTQAVWDLVAAVVKYFNIKPLLDLLGHAECFKDNKNNYTFFASSDWVSEFGSLFTFDSLDEFSQKVQFALNHPNINNIRSEFVRGFQQGYKEALNVEDGEKLFNLIFLDFSIFTLRNIVHTNTHWSEADFAKVNALIKTLDASYDGVLAEDKKFITADSNKGVFFTPEVKTIFKGFTAFKVLLK